MADSARIVACAVPAQYWAVALAGYAQLRLAGILQANRSDNLRANLLALQDLPGVRSGPWNGSSDPVPKDEAAPKEKRDPLKLARHLGVSGARVTQVLRRLRAISAIGDSE